MSRFDEFWKVYPKKKNKKDAHKAWGQVNAEVMVDKLIEDVILRCEKDAQWIAGYAPYPATYLRGSRWDDDFSGYGGKGEANQGLSRTQRISNKLDDIARKDDEAQMDSGFVQNISGDLFS